MTLPLRLASGTYPLLPLIRLNGTPQAWQNLLPSGFWVPHLAQAIAIRRPSESALCAHAGSASGELVPP